MNLITDRTKYDMLLGTEKGHYGIADLNRVEKAVEELSALVVQLGVRYSPEVKTDWSLPGAFSAESWPTQRQMQRYLQNVKDLCAAAEVFADFPASMARLTWTGANQIEQALAAVAKRIEMILQIFQFSGELFAGEENGI